MGFPRVLICLLFPPLAVLDKGCGAVTLVFVLTLFGWIPGVIVAVILCMDKSAALPSSLTLAGNNAALLVLSLIAFCAFAMGAFLAVRCFRQSGDAALTSDAEAAQAHDSPPHAAPAATPVPVKLPASDEALHRAVVAFPELGVSGSPLNRKFWRQFEAYQHTEAEYFDDPEWPSKLAAECQRALSDE